jgi:hypothetical protein
MSTTYSRETYIENTKKLLSSASTKVPGEFTAMELIVGGNVQAGTAQFKKSAQGYADVTQSLITVSVPEDAVDMHLALLDALSAYVDALNRLSAIETDAIVAATGYTSLSSAQSAFYTAMAEWAKYVLAHSPNSASTTEPVVPQENE